MFAIVLRDCRQLVADTLLDPDIMLRLIHDSDFFFLNPIRTSATLRACLKRVNVAKKTL